MTVLNVKYSLTMFFVCSILFGQTKQDEWHLYASSRENYYGVAMANGQIGIVTDDTDYS
jgi:protein-glucosylgalactosylhydroxylysine glucosidase